MAQASDNARAGRAAEWLSQGLEVLVHQLETVGPREADFDVAIIGSGYGGSIAAEALAGATHAGKEVSVCVLERGNEYLPGSFPSRMADLPRHTRFSTENGTHARGEGSGLFDFRIGSAVSSLLANGLGGGSLINAGVMVEPAPAVRIELEKLAGPLGPYYDRVRRLLGAHGNTIERHDSGTLPLKFTALKDLSTRIAPSATTFSAAEITMAMQDGPNAAGVKLDACRQCGDCATGCNHNAKDSLDTNLLVRARRNGASIYTGATLVRFERDPQRDLWRLHVAYTDTAMRKRQPAPFIIYARKLILAAGSYGSTEILLRSRSSALRFSPKLGQQFSSNGDMIAVAYDQQEEVNAIADENMPPHGRAVGPTITGMIRHASALGDLLIEDLAVPGPMRRLFEELVTTCHTLQQIGVPDKQEHRSESAGEQDPCAVDAKRLRRSSVLAVMGDDGAQGRMELSCPVDDRATDGAIRVRWPELSEHPLFERQVSVLESARAGTVLPNPMWKPLSAAMENVLGRRRGPLLTVHPLGGCPMGAGSGVGVVNRRGQVFTGDPATPAAVYDSLAVLDGAVVPRALGVNPALTIAAMSLCAIEALREAWGWSAPAAAAASDGRRPLFRAMTVPEKPQRTQVEFRERLAGPATLRAADGTAVNCTVELTLHFDPVELASLILPQDGQAVPLKRVLVAGKGSTLRIYRKRKDKAESVPLLEATLSGKLAFMHRAPSTQWQRIGRAAGPWLRNRGLRDLYQWATQERAAGSRGNKAGNGVLRQLLARFGSARALASRAGEIRLFDYELTIGHITLGGPGIPGVVTGQPIRGQKRLTYARAGNPWNQLMRMTLTQFPGLVPDAAAPVLDLDTGFLIRENLPLMRILRQQDQPSALADVAGLAGWLLRVLLNIHTWSFRKPDSPPPRAPQRLPGRIPGLPAPEITEIEVDRLRDGTPVHARLTRYRRDDTASEVPPVMAIHGYSTSGTTFAHELLNPNLASYLWHRKHDVWILDLRTSIGMPTAHHPWTFEDAAYADIPAAVEHICWVTQRAQVDVVAHCMGAAMMGMAILGDPRPGERFPVQREQLPRRVRRLLLSQVGPLVVFSPTNIFRAYLMNFVRHLLPMVRYEFHVKGAPSLADELLDRVLATLPYPERDFDIENPLLPWHRADFVGLRRRMDALYGRDFELVNIDQPVLDHLADIFDAPNLVTIGQAIHFARHRTIANGAGRNVYVSRTKLQKRWLPQTHCIHGAQNGLSDIATLERMRTIFEDAGIRVTGTAFPRLGHQDCWIGRDAVAVFAEVARFLEQGPQAVVDQAPEIGAGASDGGALAPSLFVAAAPWTGPVRAGIAHTAGDGVVRTPVGAATDEVLNRATFVAFVPVQLENERYRIWGTSGKAPGAAIQDTLELYCPATDPDGWIRLQPAAAPTGAAGTLMLMLHHQSRELGSVPGFPIDLESLEDPAVHNHELMQYVRSGKAPDQEQNPALSLAYNALTTMLNKVYEAIEVFVVGQSATLGHAVIARAPHDPATGTALAPGIGGEICFAAGSCQYPAGLLDDYPAFAAYRRLAARLDDPGPTPKPGFVLLMGDQVYTDATAGLFDPTALDDRYVRPYEKLLSNKDVRNVLRRLPAYMMLDDHEIANNWEPEGATPDDPNLHAGVDAYRKYQRSPASLAGRDGNLWFHFEAGGIPFFVADTRTEREARTPSNFDRARIMSERQFGALLDWLDAQHRSRPAGRPIFIVTPSILTPHRLGLGDGPGPGRRLRSDAWDGYPESLHRLLAHITAGRIEHVVFLSGDEHISCDATIEVSAPGQSPIAIRSIHCSGLYTPFPFANAQTADFANEGSTFRFTYPRDSSQSYHCLLAQVACLAGDGFAIIRTTRHGGGWNVDCQFDRATPGPDQVAAQAGPTRSEPRQTRLRCGSGPRGREMPQTGGP